MRMVYPALHGAAAPGAPFQRGPSMQHAAGLGAADATPIAGTYEPRFQGLRDFFQRCFDDYDDLGASLAVTQNGRLVVDLWGGWKDRARTQPWTRETLAPLWSGTKAVTALCFAMLVDRGKVSYDDPVSRIWPAFGQAGKDTITLAQWLSHQGGVTGFIEPTTLETLFDIDRAAATLAAQAPFWPPGTACGYHAMSLGPVNETLMRKIDGRSVKAFLRDEVAVPFDLGISIGLDPSRHGDVAEVVRADEGLKLGGFFKVEGEISAIRPQNSNLNAAQKATMNPPIDGLYANQALWRVGDMPAANGFGNARSLAELYALALGHAKNGRTLASPAALAAARRERIACVDEVKRVEARWAAAFQVNDGLYGPNRDTVYHAGMGGTFTLGDPVVDLTVSYVPNRLGDRFEADPRRRGVIDAAYACLAG